MAGFIDKMFQYSPFKRKPGAPQNLRGYVQPMQLQRIRQNILSWRDSLTEAEQAYFPHRVKLQRLFQDTILNGHVFSCIERRKNLSLLKDFIICDSKGVEDEKTTALFRDQSWFNNLLSYSLDAKFFGYSLISLGDIEDNKFPNLELIQRQNISPDRENVTSYVNSIYGVPFSDPEFTNWNIWVTTPSDLGVSKCGYGLLYKIAVYEIYCRNVLAQNGDFTEMFSQPYRVGKTTKTEEAERAEFEMVLRDMGSAGYAIMDPQDEISFLETSLGGTGYKGYESMEARCEKKISKLTLNHADAMDSTPGKLGETDSVKDALKEIEVADNKFIEALMNDQVIPKLRNLGFQIPIDRRFKYKNDKEQLEEKEKQDASNKLTADIVKTLFDSGVKVDPAYITERTGIPFVEMPKPEATEKKPFDKSIQNKLDDLYV